MYRRVYNPSTTLGPALNLPCDLQAEIDDMIWEVDEDCDQKVNWEEFQCMHERCRDDKTGVHMPRSYSAASMGLG